jgi:hypothetical protein
MDGSRFDALTRALVRALPRRGALAGLLGAAAAASSGAPTGTAKRRAPESCRYPGLPCRKSKDCCGGMTCAAKRCQCRPELTQCGDFCIEDALADNYDCCKPYKSPCVPDDPTIRCCSDGFRDDEDSCVEWRPNEFVCCGLYFHPCTPENEAYCCSGQCGANGRCVAEQAMIGAARRGDRDDVLPDRPGAAPRGISPE